MTHDAVIIGGGIGGLVSAALLAAEGKDILLLEQHGELGGCAATFSRGGFLFDAGATIGCGFQASGPMSWLAQRLDLRWPVAPLSVAWEYCDGRNNLLLDKKRRSLLQQFPAAESFWKEQADVADRLWSISEKLLAQFKRPRLQQAASLLHFLPAKIVPKVLQLASMSAASWLQRHNLHRDQPFCRFIDAQLLISAQTIAPSCSALFAAMALDLPRQSPCSIIGGMGGVAETLSRFIIKQGGRLKLGEKALSFAIEKRRISEVISRKGRYKTKEVIFNGSGADLAPLLKNQKVPLTWQTRNRAQWGAFILHIGVKQEVISHLKSSHLQLIDSSAGKLAEGASLFLSTAHPQDTTRGPEGKVPLTVSTHTAVQPWWEARKKGKSAYNAMKFDYTKKLLDLLETHVPDVRNSMDFCIAGTPVTYARYTSRHLGLVGGYAQDRILPPRQEKFGLKNCTLVGDFTFPGQSIAAVTVGAALAADRLLRRL